MTLQHITISYNMTLQHKYEDQQNDTSIIFLRQRKQTKISWENFVLKILQLFQQCPLGQKRFLKSECSNKRPIDNSAEKKTNRAQTGSISIMFEIVCLVLIPNIDTISFITRPIVCLFRKSFQMQTTPNKYTPCCSVLKQICFLSETDQPYCQQCHNVAIHFFC